MLYMNRGWTAQPCDEVPILNLNERDKKRHQKQYEKVLDSLNIFPFAMLSPQC